MQNQEAYKFTNEDAENYDLYLGPVLFEPYGQYLASQIDTANVSAVLELAGGTGRVTQHIYNALPAGTEFWATDLNTDMLDISKRRLGNVNINFKAEDIQKLSFPDNSFDLVICQFGMMFLPDKQKGFNEIYRVLKPGGKLMCFTWNSTLHNPIFNLLINELMLPYFEGEDNTRLFVPFSLYDRQQLAGWLHNAGFTSANTEIINLNSGTASLQHMKTGFFYKHPLGKAVKDKDVAAFEVVGGRFGEEIEKHYGTEFSFPMSALLTIGVK
jgi:ubiquinone/menaquinone biosynthesis C-methylase UbiE